MRLKFILFYKDTIMPESSLLRKSDGFNKLYDAYQKTLLNWPVKYTSRTITSSEGETHIIESGHHNKGSYRRWCAEVWRKACRVAFFSLCCGEVEREALQLTSDPAYADR